PLCQAPPQRRFEEVARRRCELGVREMFLVILGDEAELDKRDLVLLVDEPERVDAVERAVRIARRRVVLLEEPGLTGVVRMARLEALEPARIRLRGGGIDRQ